MSTIFKASDLFCGAGGSSTGLIQAANELGIKIDLLAINHWQKAVDTHKMNHPWARHECADLSAIDPSKMIPGGMLDLLIASPECTHHSIARGGKPCSDQSRASAWHVLHWAERLQISDILVENVREFEGWGPLLHKSIRYRGKLYRRGRPDPRRKGETFGAFIAALKSLGYTVDHRVLNAADYGDATSRHRLFVRATRAKRIVWPEATHAGQWRAAREIIDWSIKGQSIFNRNRPLKPKTLARIEAGLKKFGGEAFIAVLRGTRDDQEGSWSKSVDDPLQTISAGGVHAALCEPFILGQHSGGAPRGVSQPMPTICTESRGIALVQPFIIPMEHSARQPVRSQELPLPTITTARGGSFGLCQPFCVNVAHSGGERVSSVDAPLGTIPAGHRGEIGICEPFITKYYGTAGASSVTEPLDTITTKHRFALVEPGRMDILFRMLQPSELAAAMGFDGYHFAGTKTDQVRQIGNAVSVRQAKAICKAIICNRRFG